MTDVIKEVLSDVESIKSSLEILSTKGMPIIDTYANISTWVNMVTAIISTFIGTAIGTRFTMKLFKSQENMRIKEDFRLEFFKKYNSLYRELVEELDDLYKRMQQINQIIEMKNQRELYLIKDPTIDYNGKQDWNIDYPKSMLKKQIELSKSIKYKKEKMRKYIKNNKTIYKNGNELYEEVYIEIDFIFRKFNTISNAYEIIDLDDNPGFLKTEKIAQQQQHNEVIIDVLNIDKELEYVIDEMQLIHEKIENEFIGKYFKQESITNKYKL